MLVKLYMNGLTPKRSLISVTLQQALSRESESFVDFRAKNSFFIGPRTCKQVLKSSVCYLVLEKYFQNKNCEAFLSVHEWAHDLYQKCHKRDPKRRPKCRKRDQTKYCIKRNPDDRISYEVYENVCKLLSIICVLLNTKFHNTSENFYFEVISSWTIVSCKVTSVTNRYMDFILNLDEEFNFQRPICLDSNRKHYYQSKTCW